jgi:methylated-DNA-[protein]-cysteine S-methyltransferase
MTALLEPTKTVERLGWLVEGNVGKVWVECSDRCVSTISFVSAAPPDSAEPEVEPFWVKSLLQDLREYLMGQVVSFDDYEVDLNAQPPFRRKVLELCRRIPYGETVTYQELARRADNSQAVRAVGSAMSHNPIPIIIPCHRVVRTGGGLGGFSAPDGVSLKQRLLDMESRSRE